MSNTQQEDGGIGNNEIEALIIKTSNEIYYQSSEEEKEEEDEDEDEEEEEEEEEEEDSSILSPVCKPYDPERVRAAIAYMIIVDGLPLKFLEGEGFKNLVSKLCPGFIIPSRREVAMDCYQLYVKEMTKLKSFMKTNCESVCISTDTWASLQGIDYICITAHFIDNEWNLQKKILNFVAGSSHRGEDLAEALEICLHDWGLKNVLTITVDNASSNDTAVAFLTEKMLNLGSGIASCKYLHMRCIAHVIDLVASDALEDIIPSVERVRDAVRYIKISSDRLKKFKECADLEGIDSKSSLYLDVPTSWNSTYLMLTIAEKFERAFVKFDELDSSFRADLEDVGVPTLLDWTCVRKYAGLLKIFHDFTLRISRPSCVTSSSFFREVSELPLMLNEWKKGSVEGEAKSLDESMKKHFDKYWGDSEKMNKIIFWANVFDPRVKFDFMEFLLDYIHGAEKGADILQCVKNEFFELFNEYKNKYPPNASDSTTKSCSGDAIDDETFAISLMSQFKKYKLESGLAKKKGNELELYLSEGTIEDWKDFDLLKWWKASSRKFPILSRMARDILAVPVSSVAPESAFNVGGRALDAFRSSLPPKFLEALICAQDWLRGSERSPVCDEEQLEELEEFEKELSQMELEEH